MTKLQRFIPQTPDPYLRQSDQLGSVKFGHLNALVDAINSTVYGDYLQLAGDGPMSTTLRALEDPEGNIANLYLATDKTAISGSLKIGNSDANLGSAILQVDSTTQGVLFPRMTVAERDAITSPAIGLLIYNTDDLVLNGWNGIEWTEVGGGGGLALLDDALMTDTLTQVVDKENTPSALRISTTDVTNYGGGAVTTNTAFGSDALINNTTGSNNTSFGINALLGNTEGASNVALGSSALQSNLTGQSNIGVGTNALNSSSTGNFNTVVGTQSAIGISTGSNNVVLGAFAIPTLNGSNNTILGYNTGQGITTGSNNTILGSNVAGLSASLSNNIIIADGSGNQRVVVDENGNVGLNNGTSTTQATSVIRSLGTNSGIAIVPNGTGAITAQVPDGTVAGGNARGQNSVDFQKSRTSNAHVAFANNSFIGGGRNNTVSIGYGNNEGGVVVGGVSNTVGANYGFIGGGSGNYLGGNDNYQVIVGGASNFINASGGAFIGGGLSNSISGGGIGYQVIAGGRSNVGGSQYTVISGGQSNTANSGSHATVVGGQGNTSSGLHSISGGFSSIASGFRSVALGNDATASNSSAVALGLATASGQDGSFAAGYFPIASGRSSVALGSNLTSSGICSISTGVNTLSYLFGHKAHASGQFSTQGDAQQSTLVARKFDDLTTGGTTVLSLDGTGTTNLIIPNGNNRSWNVKVETIAVVIGTSGTVDGVSVGDSLMQDDTILFTKVGGTSSVVGVNNTNLIASTSMGTAGMSFAAGASQELAITFTAPTFTGGGSVTCRVVSKVSLVEVAW